MSEALTVTGVSQRYGRSWALRDCSVSVPRGRVAALVGPNGAGKTTLLHTCVGLLAPTRGSVLVFGEPPGGAGRALPRLAFLAQEKPLYEGFTVAETLRLGARLNPRWDHGYAERRIAELDIPPGRRVGRLSGGQRAQVALTLALGKRPDLLVLDEPMANLDPLARHDVMRGLMTAVAETGLTVLLSSHLMSDLDETCDWLVVLNRGRVQVSGDIDELRAAHRVLSGPVGQADGIAARTTVVDDSRGERQATLLVRHGSREPALDPRWTSRPVGPEALALAYLRSPDATTLPRPTLVGA